MSNLFETATRKKYRFPYRGNIGVEDLWDLTLDQLDTIYAALSKTAETKGEKSLLNKPAVDQDLLNEIEIVKYVFNTKTDEAKALREAAQNAEKKQMILEIIESKQNEKLRNMSDDDLQKMLDELK